ncbi:hypothetical protein GCM10027422_08170 [Hymenobacter arcticus]
MGQTLYTFNGGGTTGDWTKANTWTTDPTGSTRVAARVPGNGDNIVITNSFVVQVNSAIATTGLKITIQRGGVLNLKSSKATFATLNTLAGQGTLRIGAPYFPAVTTNNFDDANTGTVEYYNWGATAALPSTATQYNNLRLLNDTTTTYTAQLDNTLTLTGSLALVSTSPTATNPQVTFNLGKAATARTLTVQGDITVGGATVLGVTNANALHTLNAGGSFINNGTVDLYNSQAQNALLNFTGSTDASFACRGITDLSVLQLNKGIDSQVLLDITATVASGGASASNLRLLNTADGIDRLSLINGVAKLGNNITLPQIHNGNDFGTGFSIGSTSTSPTLWVAGATLQNNNARGAIVYGTYRIDGGRFECITPDAMVIREDGQVLVEGGTTQVDKMRPSSTTTSHRGSFIMTGGLFECLGTVQDANHPNFARFAVPYLTQSFRMTGGTIRVQNPGNATGIFHIGINSNNAIVSGGTIEVVLPSTAAECKISSTVPLWNLSIVRAATTGTAQATLAAVTVPTTPTDLSPGATVTAQPLTVLNNFNVGGVNTTLGTNTPAIFNANALALTIQGTLTIASGSTYLPGNNNTIFSGGQDQQLVNNGIIGATAGTNTFYNWTVDKSAGTLVLAGSAKNYTVAAPVTAPNPGLSLLNGVLSDNGSTINVLGNMVNSASHTSGGGTGSITLAGSVNQTVSGNDQGIFGNLNINSGVAAGGIAATFTANMSVASALNFISENILAIGANRLSLTNVSTSDAISGTFSNKCFVQTAGNQSDLGLQKTYGGADNFIFPVGTGTKYAPANVILSLATTLAKYGQVSVSPTATRNPFVTNGTAGSLAYYWKVRSTGFGPIPDGAINMRFTMTNTDASGTLTNYVPGRYVPVSWTPQYTDPNLVVESATTSSIRFNALNQFEGEYTAGLPGATGAFGAVTAFYSRNTGNWTANTTWSTVSNSGTAVPAGSVAGVNYPSANNPVFIGSFTGKIYHTVTVAADAANAGSLVIDRGSIMDVGTTTGHNFGALPDAKIGGSGRLRVSAKIASGATAPYIATFPGGDFGSFLQENGGTVEYYTTGNVDFTVPTVSGTLSLNSYKNLWADAASGRTITLPNLGLRVFSQLKTGTSAGTGLVLLSAAANGDLRADSLIAVQAGTLRYANGVARTLTADTDVRLDAGATLDVSSVGTAVANALTIGGSLTNNGTLDFNLGNGRIANLTFLGSQNTKFTGPSATLTDLYTLTLNKGLGQAATLSLDVAGTLTTPTSGWLTLTNGTLRYAKTAGTQLLTIHDANSPYLIPDNAGFTMDAPGATVTVATNTTAPATNTSSASDLKLAGQLQVLQGTFNVGTTGVIGNDLEYASAGRPTIGVGTGGTLYVNGQIRRTTANTNGSLRYDQSGGTVEIRGARAEVYQNNERGLLEVQGPGSIFRMSGGTLALRGTNTRPTIIADLYLRPDSTVVTAGTVLLGNLVSGNITVSLESLVPLYDVKVENGNNTSSTNTGLLTGLNPLNLKGSLTIGNDNAYFNANGLPLNIDRDLVNNNASTNTGLTNGGFQPGTAAQTTTFTGKGPAVQQLTSTAANLTVFGGLVVNNAQTGGTLQLGRNARVIGTLNLAKGTLADNGQTLTSLGDIINSATHTSSGSGSLTLLGTVNQNIDGNGKGKFGNVVLNNTAGATTLANQEITGVLTLTNGVLTIGSNLLNLSNPAAGAVAGTFSSSNFIRTNGIVADLGVRKSYPSGALNFLFPIGAATKYTPVTMNVTANTAAGTLTVQPIDLAHPSTTDPAAKELGFYWKVRSTGFSNPIVTQVFTYVDNGVGNDVNGTEANYKLGRFLNGAWIPAAVAGVGGIPTSTVNTGNNTLTNAAATYLDGDYTGGEPSEFGLVPTFYSRNSTAGLAGGGKWNDPTTWTNNADGSNPSVAFTSFPTLANPVVIRSGHLVNGAPPLNTGDAGHEAASLQLLGSLNLNNTTANNFNTVTGSGTVRIGSALFPAGNYAAFMDATGGTVDYTAAVQLPARDTYNNLTFTGGNTKLLSNLDLTINGTLSVAAGTTVNNPTSQGITLTSATSGATLAGTVNLNDGPLTTGAFLTNSGTLNLGAGAVSIGTAFTNSGTLNNGSGALAVGTSLTNSGTYNATVGEGTLDVGTGFANNGTYNAGKGTLTIGGDFSNAAGKGFVANTGSVLVAGNFSNAGSYTVADGVSGNLLRIVGDFNNLANSSFAAATSTLVLRGNFTNNSGLGFDASGGLVQFITDDSRRLTGATTFYDVQKVGASTLTLGTSSDITVKNVLTLSNGLVVTGTTNTLSLTNSAVQPIVGTSTSAYVAGRLAITLPTAVAMRVFPVGLGGRYRPVTLKTEGTSSKPQVILTEIFNGAPTGKPDATLSNLSANRYYRIQRLTDGTLAPISVQLSYNTDVVDEEVHVPGNLRVAQLKTDGTWGTAGGSGVFSPADPRGYTTSASAQTLVNTTSFFALASTNEVDNPLTGRAPLPVQLLSFTAARQGSAVRAAWATASEVNSAYFVVERSADGRTFSDVQRVAAQGSSVVRHDYAALDALPLPGTSYYRLRQVDQDGTVAYSPTVAVRFDGALAAPALAVYPNPTAGQRFQVLASNLATTGGTVQLFDALGRLVLTQVAAAGTAEATIQPAQTLASGLYFVTWQTADGLKLTTKVVVN